MLQTINLYHAALEPPPERFTARQTLWGLGALLAVLTAALGLVQWRTQQAQAEAAALAQASVARREALTAVSRAAQPDEAMTRELQQLRQREAGERRLRSAIDTGEAGAGDGFSPELLALARRAQAQVWITGLLLNRADNSLELRGRTTAAARLPDYLQSLQDEPTLKGRPFAQMVVRGDGQDLAGNPLPYAEFIVRTNARTETLPPANGGKP
jgi:Tfp pilus assembly protein PilN